MSKPKITEQNPCAWLLAQIAIGLPPEVYAALMADYRAQQLRYSRAVKIRALKREIATFERIIALYGEHSSHPRCYADRLVRKRAKLAELEAQQ